MDFEERAIYAGLLVIGGPVAAIHIARGDIGVGATLALLLAILGSVGLVHSWLRSPRLPLAHTRRR